jgi:ribose transport system ATP-binding protein
MESRDSHPSSSEVLLEARGIVKSFPGVRALDGVQLTVRSGRLTALVGENGAGKSTLMNILAGVFPPDAGEVRLCGQTAHFRNPREAQAAGISIIFQELHQVANLSVAENIFLGREPLTPFGLIDYAAMNHAAAGLLAQLELKVDPRTLVGQLRVGQQQVVEIAKALSFNARVVIMDEPTSAITEQEVAVLFGLIRQLKERGVGIIYITHKLDELLEIADDIAVFRDGRFIGERSFAATTREEMIRMMVGRDLAGLYERASVATSEPVLRIRELSLPHPERPNDFLVEEVSFTLHRGEVLGIFGLMGAGRTEMLETLFGRHPRVARGRIWVEGVEVSIQSPQDAIAAGLALAPEDRKAEGLVLPMTVAENVTLASLARCERFGLLQAGRERETTGRFVERLRIKTPSIRQLARNLSGGNQQKVVLAKWLATEPKVLLLDEPTRGIDINAKKEIYSLIDELVRGGLGVVMVSSEMPEILAVADRIFVLCEGRVTGEFSRSEATEESLLHAALPVGEPL